MGAKLGQHVYVELAFERDDQPWQLLGIDPAEGVELGMLRGQVDVRVAPGKPHQKPFLPLAAKAATPYPAGELRRKVVGHPAAALGDDLGLAGADFLFELAHRRLARRFAPVDPALRHLPSRCRRQVGAAGDKNMARHVQQHDADTLPVARAVAVLPHHHPTPFRSALLLSFSWSCARCRAPCRAACRRRASFDNRRRSP